MMVIQMHSTQRRKKNSRKGRKVKCIAKSNGFLYSLSGLCVNLSGLCVIAFFNSMGRGHDDGHSNAFHAKTQKNFTQRAQSKCIAKSQWLFVFLGAFA
jgi:hypothetical protein